MLLTGTLKSSIQLYTCDSATRVFALVSKNIERVIRPEVTLRWWRDVKILDDSATRVFALVSKNFESVIRPEAILCGWRDVKA